MNQHKTNNIYTTIYFKILSCFVLLMLSLLIALRVNSFFYFSTTKTILLSFLISFVLYISFNGLAKKYNNCSTKLPCLFFSICCTYSMQIFVSSSKSLIWVFLFVFIYIVLYLAFRLNTRKAIIAVSLFLGTLFALFEYTGFVLVQYDGLPDIELHAGLVMQVWGFVSLIVLFSSILLLILNYTINEIKPTASTNRSFSSSKKWIYIVSIAFGILTCWLIYYIAFYPGCLTIDSNNELSQQMGDRPLSNWHPIIHQMLIKLGLLLGSESVTKGIGIYSLIQMIIMAFIFSYCIVFIAQQNAPKWMLFALFAFYSFVSINALYSITVWKDVLFGGFSVLLIVLLFQEINEGSKKATLRAIIIVAVAFLFCTFRNNGYYAFIISFPFIIAFNIKNWKRLIPIYAIVILLVSAYKFVLFDVLEIEKSPYGEALSVPIQQIARTVKKDGVDSTDKNYKVLSEVFVDFDSIGDRYSPYVADNVKNPTSFLSDVFSLNPTRYAKAWLDLGLNHPKTYIEAFLFLNHGYWYTDTTYWTAYAAIDSNTYGLNLNPKYADLRSSLVDIHFAFSEKQPTAILTSPAFVFWLILISMAIFVLKKQKSTASVLFIPLAIWFTTLASPVFCEFRYIYGLFTIAPISLFYSLCIKKVE